jgi:hypothetical protein
MSTRIAPVEPRQMCVTRGCKWPAEIGHYCERCYEAVEEARRERIEEQIRQREFDEYWPPMPHEI